MASVNFISLFKKEDSVFFGLSGNRALTYFVVPLLVVLIAPRLRSSRVDSPILNPPPWLDVSGLWAKFHFAFNARAILEKWFSANPAKPAAMYSEAGLITILPPSMAEEICHDQRLGFSEFIQYKFHGTLPGFEPYSTGTEVMQKVVMRHLAKQMNALTMTLAEETSLALSELFSDNTDWHDVPLADTILRLIARISSRVFLGEELCRNEQWLRVTREYTVSSFKASQFLHVCPPFSRWFMNWILPDCRDSRALVKEASRIIQPVLEHRRNLEKLARANGDQPPVFNDALQWFENEFKGRKYDPAMSQLVVSVVAIHTTSDLLSQTLADIAQHPEIVGSLRDEITEALRQDGWQKTSLYKMNLMDSVFKESQRLKPIGLMSMPRVALQDIVLSNGTAISKGQKLGVSTHRMWDPVLYECANEWDPYRFFKMREIPEKQHLAQLVTTSPDHIAFGHGKHACPGRFFAANEMKIALANLLLKYDFKLPDGVTPKTVEFGFTLVADPSLQLRVRRRIVG